MLEMGCYANGVCSMKLAWFSVRRTLSFVEYASGRFSLHVTLYVKRLRSAAAAQHGCLAYYYFLYQVAQARDGVGGRVSK